MDFQIHDISNDGEIPISYRQAKERVIPEERLKIQHVVANFFIEIANFFKRILCCEPFELYAVEKCRRVTELTLVPNSDPDSDQDDFYNEYKDAPRCDNEEIKSESDDELSNDSDSNSENINSALPVVQEHSIKIRDVFKELQSRSMKTHEVSSLFQRIATQEDAIEFIDLCISRYPLIKEVYAEEHSVREDYLRKLALSAKERPNSSESKEIIAAFEAKGLIYEKYLPYNHFTNLVSHLVFSFSPALYNKLPLQDLTQLCLTQKEIKATVKAYEAPEKFDVRLDLLIELGDRIKASEHERNLKKQSMGELGYGDWDYSEWKIYDSCNIKTEDTLTCQHYYSTLDSLLVKLKPKLLEVEESLKNNLLEYLISEKRPSISSKYVDLQKKVLELFFEHGSVDQLNRFIHSAVSIHKNVVSESGCYTLVSEFNLCFFNELTDERQKRLIPLLEIENTKIDEILIRSLVNLIKNNKNLVPLSKTLVRNFYEKRPDSKLWNEMKHFLGECYYLEATLAETKILLLMTKCLTSTNLENDAKFSRLVEEIKECINFFPFCCMNLVDESIQKILIEICDCYEAFGKETTEKLLTAFVQALSYDSLYFDKAKLLYTDCVDSIANHPKFRSLWLSGLEALMVKVLFQSFLDRNDTWHICFLQNISTEGQINAFIDFCLGLPQPLQTIQLYALKSTFKGYEDEEKKFNKILEARKIELVEDSNRNWTGREIYHNAFKMQKVFDDLLALDSQVDMERWIANKKESVEFLQALAAGIEMTDGSIIKCPLDSKDIEQAFHNNELDYKVFAKPIALYDFLKRETD